MNENNVDNKKFILASASPRRKELLKQIIEDFSIVKADLDEMALLDSKLKHTDQLNVLAQAKGQAVIENIQNNASNDFETLHNNTWILSADTMVCINDKLFGKAANVLEAKTMLQQLSGQKHQVFTSFSLFKGTQHLSNQCIQTDVLFSQLNESEIDQYLESKEYIDKAGAYAIQGLASRFVLKIDGSYSNVVGLPVAQVYQSLNQQGFYA